MQEYVIEIVGVDGTVQYLVHVERDGRITMMRPSPAGYSHVHKWRVKARAEKVAMQVTPPVGMTLRIVPTYGGFVYGSKSTVPGLKVAPKGIRG